MTTIQIPLTQGYEATIDAEDWDKVKGYKWLAQKIKTHNSELVHARAYVKKDGKRKVVWMHNLIKQAPEGMFLDHKDRNGLNNTRDNLRIATHKQNCANRVRKRGASGFIGVYACNKKFLVQVRIEGKLRSCGLYDTAWEAAEARDRVAKDINGDFAILNFPGVLGDSLGS